MPKSGEEGKTGAGGEVGGGGGEEFSTLIFFGLEFSLDFRIFRF